MIITSKSSNRTAESRRWERHAVSIPVRVSLFHNDKWSYFQGEGTDISRGGMRLFLTRELEPGASVQLEFLVPYQSSDFAMRGVVRNRAGFTHGIEFLQPTLYQQRALERACKVLGLLR